MKTFQEYRRLIQQAIARRAIQIDIEKIPARLESKMVMCFAAFIAPDAAADFLVREILNG